MVSFDDIRTKLPFHKLRLQFVKCRDGGSVTHLAFAVTMGNFMIAADSTGFVGSNYAKGRENNLGRNSHNNNWGKTHRTTSTNWGLPTGSVLYH